MVSLPFPRGGTPGERRNNKFTLPYIYRERERERLCTAIAIAVLYLLGFAVLCCACCAYLLAVLLMHPSSIKMLPSCVRMHSYAPIHIHYAFITVVTHPYAIFDTCVIRKPAIDVKVNQIAIM